MEILYINGFNVQMSITKNQESHAQQNSNN